MKVGKRISFFPFRLEGGQGQVSQWHTAASKSCFPPEKQLYSMYISARRSAYLRRWFRRKHRTWDLPPWTLFSLKTWWHFKGGFCFCWAVFVLSWLLYKRSSITFKKRTALLTRHPTLTLHYLLLSLLKSGWSRGIVILKCLRHSSQPKCTKQMWLL